MKLIIWGVIIFISMTINVNAYTIEIDDYNKNGKEISGINVTLNKFYAEVYMIFFDRLYSTDDIDVVISSSKFDKKETAAYYRYNRDTERHTIVIAREHDNFISLANSLSHELGHFYYNYGRFKVSKYSEFMFGNMDNLFTGKWEERKVEDFADEFKMFVMKQIFNIESFKRTVYKVNQEKFIKFIGG